MKLEKYKGRMNEDNRTWNWKNIKEGGKQSENDGNWKGRRRSLCYQHGCTLSSHITTILKVTFFPSRMVIIDWLSGEDCLGMWNGYHKHFFLNHPFRFLKTISRKINVIIVCSVVDTALG